MTRARALACLALLGLTAGAARLHAQAIIPMEYRGEWSNEPRYCNFEGDDLDSVLTVSAKLVGYFEESWRVRAVHREAGGLRISYHPRTDFTMYAPNFLRLSKDGRRIFTSSDPKGTGYMRCPKARN